MLKNIGQVKNFDKFSIVKKECPTFYFIGVTTGNSSMMKLFPLWMDELGQSEIKIDLSIFKKGIYFIKVNFESKRKELSKLIFK